VNSVQQMFQAFVLIV